MDGRGVLETLTRGQCANDWWSKRLGRYPTGVVRGARCSRVWERRSEGWPQSGARRCPQQPPKPKAPGTHLEKCSAAADFATGHAPASRVHALNMNTDPRTWAARREQRCTGIAKVDEALDKHSARELALQAKSVLELYIERASADGIGPCVSRARGRRPHALEHRQGDIFFFSLVTGACIQEHARPSHTARLRRPAWAAPHQDRA